MLPSPPARSETVGLLQRQGHVQERFVARARLGAGFFDELLDLGEGEVRWKSGGEVTLRIL